MEMLTNLILHSANQSSFAGGHWQDEDLNDLAARAVAMTERIAQARCHVIELRQSDEEAIANCQPAVFTQAIVNVFSNAIKYTPPNGLIQISVALGNVWNEVRVKDNGIGMSEDDIAIALQPFGRVELPAHHAQDGTGIGLPIVRDIVAFHSGQLEIDSTPNSGTTMILRLPKARTTHD